MPDPEPATTPAATVPPVVPPPATPPTAAPETVSMTSAQLKQRLDEATAAGASKLLKELGVDKADSIREALKLVREGEQAKLSEKEKLEARIKELEPHATTATQQAALIKELADEQFASLAEPVQQAIDKTAAGDPQKRLDAIRIFRAMQGAQPAAPAAPGVTPPTTTAPSPAPTPAGGVTKFQEWESMRARSPMLGDIFYQSHQREIERTRPAS